MGQMGLLTASVAALLAGAFLVAFAAWLAIAWCLTVPA